MLFLDNELVFSATDLSGFLACGHLPSLRRAAAEGRLHAPESAGGGDLAAAYGDRHEAAYLERLREVGLEVALDRPDAGDRRSLAAAHRETEQALAAGVDVIYQGTLFGGTWLGHPDFLVRRDDVGGRWPFRYDVVDAKLARHAKASALVQVALYGELLTPVQRCEPAELVLALGDGSEERVAFAKVASYLRSITRRLLAALEEDPPYPYPVEHCEVCAWSDRCDERRRKEDHLSLVADIRRQQVLRLEDAGVPTLAALAKSTTLPRVRIGEQSLSRLRRQAGEQYRSRIEGAPAYRLLDPMEEAGVSALPAPSPGDVFFDMEGFPYADDGGLEYLFGWVDADGAFHHCFAQDRGEERRAFEDFMDELAVRLARHPDMHVYHYAAYERSALSRLSNRHATREEEVADLLRNEVLVDLYGVVRHSLIAGTESYSIKALEPLYGFERTGEVKNAAESLDMYQAWLDSSPSDDTILDAIARYNEVDCRISGEEATDVLGCPAVFVGETVGVVPGHVHGRPAEPGLLLRLGDHGIDRRGMEVAKRVKVYVLGDAGPLTDGGEGVGHPVRVGRPLPARLEGEDEGSLADAGRAARRHEGLFAPEPVERPEGVGIDDEAAHAGVRLRLAHRAHAARRDDALVDEHGGSRRVEVFPPKRARLPTAHAGGGKEANERRHPQVHVVCRLEERQHLARLRSPHGLRPLGGRPRRQLGVGDRVRQRVAAPLPGQAARTVEERTNEAHGRLAEAGLLQGPEVLLDLIRRQVDEPAGPDRAAHVPVPDALVAAHRVGAQVLCQPFRFQPSMASFTVVCGPHRGTQWASDGSGLGRGRTASLGDEEGVGALAGSGGLAAPPPRSTSATRRAKARSAARLLPWKVAWRCWTLPFASRPA